ncbi:MAG: hypothetical protein WBD38_10920 [Candidatus Dormiibacterota bacterium]
MADLRVPRLRVRRRARLVAASSIVASTVILGLSVLPGPTARLGALRAIAAPTCLPGQQGQACRRSTPPDSPTPCTQDFGNPFGQCTTPTPAVIVISPVPPDPPSPATTPAYLIGLPASPTNAASEVGGAIAPLGGGSSETAPSPGSGGGGSNASESLKSTGLPVPFLFAMLVLASIGAGFLIWRYGPRGKALPRVRPAPPILLTPYGGKNRATANLLDPNADRPPD